MTGMTIGSGCHGWCWSGSSNPSWCTIHHGVVLVGVDHVVGIVLMIFAILRCGCGSRNSSRRGVIVGGVAQVDT